MLNTETLKRLLPDYDGLVSAVGVPGPGNMVVVYYTQGDCRVACISHDDQLLWDKTCGSSEPDDLVSRIKGALNTEEDGEALVEVARNAHRAELALAEKLRQEGPKCEHVWLEGFDMAGPTLRCTVCGEFRRD